MRCVCQKLHDAVDAHTPACCGRQTEFQSIAKRRVGFRYFQVTKLTLVCLQFKPPPLFLWVVQFFVRVDDLSSSNEKLKSSGNLSTLSQRLLTKLAVVFFSSCSLPFHQCHSSLEDLVLMDGCIRTSAVHIRAQSCWILIYRGCVVSLVVQILPLPLC